MQDVPAPSGETDLEITELSLQSMSPVNGKDVFVGLNPDVASTGSMTIIQNDNNIGGTWDSSFSIKGMAVVADAGTLVPSGVDYIRGLIANCGTASDYECYPVSREGYHAQNEAWTDDPGPGDIVGPESSTFFIPSGPTPPIPPDEFYHIVGSACHGSGTCIPEPTTIISSLFGVGILGWRKLKSA